MGLNDRDWYQEEMRKKAGGHQAKPSAHRQSKTPPQRDEGPTKVYMGLGTPPEPQHWPLWLVVLAWILVFGGAFALATALLKQRQSDQPKQPGVSIVLPDCTQVASGPCVKR